jgi:hypothetical protein
MLRRKRNPGAARVLQKYWDRKNKNAWRVTPLRKEQIEEIRRQWQMREKTQFELAVHYKVSQSTISRIIRDEFRGKAA